MDQVAGEASSGFDIDFDTAFKPAFESTAEPKALDALPQSPANPVAVKLLGLQKQLWDRLPTPELGLALICVLVALVMSLAADLPFSFPDVSALAFTGMHPAVPIGLISAWLGVTMLSRFKFRVFYYVTAAFAYCVILVVHFNIKLWMAVANPVNWDDFYWRVDGAVRPVIDLSFGVHDAAAFLLPFENHLYLFAFLAMFLCSIVIHSMRCFMVFRRVIFSAMLVHALGAISYLIMPAAGPFIYEAGSNALETARQVHMYEGYQALIAGGRPWIAENGSQYMLAAVAAMPSLHVASSGVFLYYAWKHERWLGLCYLPLFTFILFEAMSTRWHYAVDLIAGIGLTALAIWIAAIIFAPIERRQKAEG
jgi:PAP2 superfamily